MKPLVLCTWMMVAGVAHASAQVPCAPDAAVAKAKNAQTELLRQSVEEMSTEVSPALQGRLREFKAALGEAVGEGMRCVSPGADAVEIQQALVKLLDANRPEKAYAPPSKSGVYGAGSKIAVSTPSNASSLRAVQIRFGIECGDDTILQLYRASAAGWEPVLTWQSGDYKEVSGAFGDFFLDAVVPAAGTNEVQVVAAHGTPWCTSRFSGFGMDLLKPVAGKTTPLNVWHLERGLSRGDVVPRLKAIDGGFEFRVNAPALAVDDYERTVIYRYTIDGDKVTRVGPIATNGRGFVEEWLSMPWDEAVLQTAPEAAEALRVLHGRRAQLDKGAYSYVSYTDGPVRACVMKGEYEVQMNAEPGGPEFYAIREGKGGYTMVNYGNVQDERCSGPDLMKTQK